MIPRDRIRPLSVLTFWRHCLRGIRLRRRHLAPGALPALHARSLLPGAMSQDIVSLMAAVGLLVCLWRMRRGAPRAWLVWVSLNGYLFYAYASIPFEQIYNPLYLVYIAMTGLTLYSLIFFFAWLDRGLCCAHRCEQTSPARRRRLSAVPRRHVRHGLVKPHPARHCRPDATRRGQHLRAGPGLLSAAAGDRRRATSCDRPPMGALLTPIVLVKVGALGSSVLLGELLRAAVRHRPCGPVEVGIYALMGLGQRSPGPVGIGAHHGCPTSATDVAASPRPLRRNRALLKQRARRSIVDGTRAHVRGPRRQPGLALSSCSWRHRHRANRTTRLRPA